MERGNLALIALVVALGVFVLVAVFLDLSPTGNVIDNGMGVLTPIHVKTLPGHEVHLSVIEPAEEGSPIKTLDIVKKFSDWYGDAYFYHTIDKPVFDLGVLIKKDGNRVGYWTFRGGFSAGETITITAAPEGAELLENPNPVVPWEKDETENNSESSETNETSSNSTENSDSATETDSGSSEETTEGSNLQASGAAVSEEEGIISRFTGGPLVYVLVGLLLLIFLASGFYAAQKNGFKPRPSADDSPSDAQKKVAELEKEIEELRKGNNKDLNKDEKKDAIDERKRKIEEVKKRLAEDEKELLNLRSGNNDE